MLAPIPAMTLIFIIGPLLSEQDANAQALLEACTRLDPLRKQLKFDSAKQAVEGLPLRSDEIKLTENAVYSDALDALCASNQKDMLLLGRTMNEWIGDLKSPNMPVRMSAAEKLGSIHADIRLLTSALSEVQAQDPDEFVRHFAREALTKMKHSVETPKLP